jgi:glutamate dehydrogenase (NADP+)
MNKILPLTSSPINNCRSIQGTILFHGKEIGYILACDLTLKQNYPFKGGLRFSATETLESLAKSANRLTEKAMLFDIPFRGAKMAILMDPKLYTEPEIDEIVRLVVTAIHPHMGKHANAFIPAPDVGVPYRIATVIQEAYEACVDGTLPYVVTGKLPEAGGCPLRPDATGMGAYFCMEALRMQLGLTPQDMTVTVAGLGKSTLPLLRLLHENGYKIIGVSDSTASLYSSSLPIQDIISQKENGISLREFSEPHGLLFSNPDLMLYQPATVMVLGAKADHLTEANMKGVSASHILEIANNAISDKALIHLNDQSVPVIPASLASAGGLFMSYIEWKHDCKGGGTYSQKELEDAKNSLKDKMETHCKARWKNYPVGFAATPSGKGN